MSTKKAEATDKMRKGINDVMYGRMPVSFELSTEDLPDIKDWSVGKTYTIELKVKQMSSSINNYEGSPKQQLSHQSPPIL